MNNAIGVPMVLLGLEPRHGQAVVEIGTSGPGEIAYGSNLAQPDVAVLTLVACAHTLGLGSIEAVAEEKGAIFASLTASGVCVANADDPHAMAQVHRSKCARVLTFGRHPEADVRVIQATSRGWQGQDLRMQVRWESRLHTVVASVPLLGGAGVYASSAALAVALAVSGDDRDLASAVRGLGNLRAELGRLRPRPLARGAVMIDDAYNANPASMGDSIEVAAALAAEEGRSLTLVLGEMRELGAQSEREHRLVGEQVARLRPGLLVAVSGDAKHYAQVAASSGVSSVFVPDAAGAVGPLLEGVGDRDVILVKGSRGVALEGVIRSLEAWGEEEGS
jgi:UDP-N-acetylmuramoyl-tripeptide--D-alanyl-D-alanine ligase